MGTIGVVTGCSKDPVAVGNEFAEKVCDCHRKAPNSSVANYRKGVEECQAAVEKEYEAAFAKLEQDPEAHMKLRKTIVEQLLTCERQMMLEGGK